VLNSHLSNGQTLRSGCAKGKVRATFKRLDKIAGSVNPDEACALLQEVNDLLDSDHADAGRPTNPSRQSD